MESHIGTGTHVTVVAHEDQAPLVVGVEADQLVTWLEALGCSTTLTVHTAPARESHLSVREREILALIGSGLTNTEIAERVFLSINTVKSYIRSAYGKIGADSRSGAVRWAIRHDLAQAENDADHHPVDENCCQ